MYRPHTDQLNLANNRRIETYLNRPMTADKFYIESLSQYCTIMAKLTNHFQWTRLITSLTDEDYSLDSDDFCSGCQSVSHQQQFTETELLSVRVSRGTGQ